MVRRQAPIGHQDYFGREDISAAEMFSLHGAPMTYPVMDVNAFENTENAAYRTAPLSSYAMYEDFLPADSRAEQLSDEFQPRFAMTTSGVTGNEGSGSTGAGEDGGANSGEDVPASVPRGYSYGVTMGERAGYGAPLQAAHWVVVPMQASSYHTHTIHGLPSAPFGHYTSLLTNQHPVSALSPEPYSSLSFAYPQPYNGHAPNPQLAPTFFPPTTTTFPTPTTATFAMPNDSGEDSPQSDGSRDSTPDAPTPKLIFPLVSSVSLRPSDEYQTRPRVATSSDAVRNVLSTALSTLPLAAPAYGTIGNAHAPFYRAGTSSTDGTSLPFDTFQTMHDIFSETQHVMPVIKAATIRNVFWLEPHWACYRRNYISVACSYQLANAVAGKPLFIEIGKGDAPDRRQVQALALRLTAVVDKAQGKEILLVQYTPKRDRGNRQNIKWERAYPESRSQSSLGGLSEAPLLPLQSAEDERCTPVTSSSAQQVNVTFDRIQFETATANNGRRRAEQQFYHLVVGLYADIRETGASEAKWTKIAHQVSDSIIVRGRSPRHYKKGDEAGVAPGGGGGGPSTGPSGGAGPSRSHGAGAGRRESGGSPPPPPPRRLGPQRGVGGSSGYSRGTGYGQITQSYQAHQAHQAHQPQPYMAAVPNYTIFSGPVSSLPMGYRPEPTWQALHEQFHRDSQDRPWYTYHPGHLPDHMPSMFDGIAAAPGPDQEQRSGPPGTGPSFKLEDLENGSARSSRQPVNREAYDDREGYTPRGLVGHEGYPHHPPVGQPSIAWSPDRCSRFQPQNTSRDWFPGLTSSGY